MTNSKTDGLPATITLHKDGEEGGLVIDRMTGLPVEEPSLRPEWASDIAVIVTSEFSTWAERFMGEGVVEAYKLPLSLDLFGYIVTDEDQEPHEVTADAEARTEFLLSFMPADVLAVIDPATPLTGTHLDVIDMDLRAPARSDDAPAFGKVEHADVDGKRKTA